MNQRVASVQWTQRLLALFVTLIILLPLFSSRLPLLEGSLWYVDQGLVLIAVIFLAYGLLGRKGLLLSKDEKGNRLQTIDIFLLFAFPLYLLYIGNEIVLTSGDTQATRYLPTLIWKYRTLDLSRIDIFQGLRLPYSAMKVGSKVLPTFPIGTGILALPYSLLALLGSWGKVDHLYVLIWEKHFAALISVAAAWTLFAGLRSRYGENVALAASLVFATATTQLSSVSQAMWSLTGEIFLVCVSLNLLLSKEGNKWQPVWMAVAMSAAFLCRPTSMIILIAFFFILWFRSKRAALAYGTTALICVAAISIFLFTLYGHPLGGYGKMNSEEGTWGQYLRSAFLGNLISPSRGILIHFPYLFLLPFIWLAGRKDAESKPLIVASIGVLVCIWVMNSFFTKWWGGHSIGPRLFAEMAPFFALLSVPLWQSWRSLGGWKTIVLLVFLFSALTQFLGAYNRTATRWNAIVKVDENPEILWSWRDSQLAATWIPWWQPSI